MLFCLEKIEKLSYEQAYHELEKNMASKYHNSKWDF